MSQVNEVFQLSFGPLCAHAFNKNRTQVAVCPNNQEVQIFEKQGSEWRLAHTLKGHDKLVTSVDWAPETNRLVTASQDRNAYVWNFDRESSQWKPTLVLLRMNRAATHVRWSPLENKFAVSSGARCIAVCYFDQENDWWVSKHLKKPIRSTVLSVDWHPNNVLLAASSSDMKARVYSAYIKGLDEKPAPSPWGERLPFSTLCAEYSSGSEGWVHAARFSPDGKSLAWVSHGSCLTVADPEQGYVQTVKTSGLPLLDFIWVTPNSILAVGHDCCPVLFSCDQSGWVFVDKLDQGQKKASAGAGTAMNKFKQMDSRGQSEQTGSDMTTTHQNTISSIRSYEGQRGSIKRFSTSGVDGRLVVWNLKSLESMMAGLRIA